MKTLLLATFAACFAVSAAAQTPQNRDWAATTRSDAQAFHELLQINHPGPHDTETPGFDAKNDAGLQQALERAGSVHTYEGYVWSLREYAASFDDGHVAISMNPALASRWPGFFVRYTRAGYVVSSRDDAFVDAPPLGARLISCDGVDADTLAAQRVGRVRGRWMLEATRLFNAWRVFIDQGDPISPPMRRCRFSSAGRTHSYALRWSPIAETAFAPHRAQSQSRAEAGIGLRAYGEIGYWISLGSFNSSPDSEDAGQLTALMAQLAEHQAQLRAADVIVLDLRGNDGGSSMWSKTVANAIWGEREVEARTWSSQYVDWRASDGNIAFLTDLRDRWSNDPTAHPDSIAWVNGILAGLNQARARNEALWREQDDPNEVRPPSPGPMPSRPRVVVIADAGCASACLDALDTWRAMGAIQVGQITSADTAYMDVRAEPLPSGLQNAVFPMKVYRGRPRGHNEPYTPHRAYSGDMADTAALEVWIGALPELQE